MLRKLTALFSIALISVAFVGCGDQKAADAPAAAGDTATDTGAEGDAPEATEDETAAETP